MDEYVQILGGDLGPMICSVNVIQRIGQVLSDSYHCYPGFVNLSYLSVPHTTESTERTTARNSLTLRYFLTGSLTCPLTRLCSILFWLALQCLSFLIMPHVSVVGPLWFGDFWLCELYSLLLDSLLFQFLWFKISHFS